jgi:NAD(P)H-dependent flavin oxidoreductase YrpB (nitropropane dioxygenase family)
MFLVSGPELVTAACRAGVIGAFPTANCRTGEELDAWLRRIRDALKAHEDATGRAAPPFCPNPIVHESLVDSGIDPGGSRGALDVAATSPPAPRSVRSTSGAPATASRA